MTTRLEAHVHGLVQGVFFRHSTRLTAQRLGITGSVSNEPNGTVLVVAEGPRESLDTLLEWLRRGPDLARVDHVDVEWGHSLGGQTDFTILR